MRPFRTTTGILCLTVGGLFLGLAGISGCARSHKVQVSQQGTPLFQELHFSCQFERESNKLSFCPVEQVSGTTGEHESSQWNQAHFEIVYPAPPSTQKKSKTHAKDVALVRVEYWKEFQPQTQTVRTLSNWGWNSIPKRLRKSTIAKNTGTREELFVKEITIPRYQLDFLLADMTRSGFFANQKRPAGEAEIVLQIDNGKVAKQWDLEPRILEMISQVLSEEGT